MLHALQATRQLLTIHVKTLSYDTVHKRLSVKIICFQLSSVPTRNLAPSLKLLLDPTNYCCMFFVCFQSFTETKLLASSLYAVLLLHATGSLAFSVSLRFYELLCNVTPNVVK